jgi:hypothetical protein
VGGDLQLEHKKTCRVLDCEHDVPEFTVKKVGEREVMVPIKSRLSRLILLLGYRTGFNFSIPVLLKVKALAKKRKMRT